MSRRILAELDPAALKSIENFHSSTVQEVIDCVSKNKTVVVGMRMNPVVKGARKFLESKNIPYVYLEYGSYFSQWKQRLAIKLWSGWPTYPQVFIDGKLIGGRDDLLKFMQT